MPKKCSNNDTSSKHVTHAVRSTKNKARVIVHYKIVHQVVRNLKLETESPNSTLAQTCWSWRSLAFYSMCAFVPRIVQRAFLPMENDACMQRLFVVWHHTCGTCFPMINGQGHVGETLFPHILVRAYQTPPENQPCSTMISHWVAIPEY